ncbi:cell division initiation protein [Streptomyces sp. YIM 98790]|uniref:cell division initiation protein n=1 Tax=Streptomyces sp. YIM 98790 TaxID=2689077 RepID=UPI00140A04F0|nr:cell division initiation protein [Streptomyces sp. YIM 98790]
MDVHQRLDEIVATVEGAKGMPMSASCVVNRADLLARLRDLRDDLPDSLSQARQVLGGRDQVVAEARKEAERIVQAAHAERGSLIESTEVVQRARAEAARILSEARREAGEIKMQADDYVDSKLANFEVVLGKTIGSVERGRDKLLGRGPGEDGYDDRDGDPRELLDRADEYVEAQFRAIETVLRKTLEAVGRGRQKLTGHRPADELGAHMAEQDALQAGAAGAPRGGYGDTTPQPAPDPYGYGGPQEQYRQPDPYAVPQQGQGGYEQYDYGSGAQDPYAPAAAAQAAAQDYYGQSAQPGGGQDPYGGYAPQPASGYQGGGALDETSFFDTGMIDTEQLRRYEQGR